MLNKTVNRTFFASLRFAVASPLYRKTPLHKKCLLQWHYAESTMKYLLVLTFFLPSMVIAMEQCKDLKPINTPYPKYPEPHQVKEYLKGTNYVHTFIEGYVSVSYQVEIDGSVNNVSITKSENRPTKEIKGKTFSGFLETNVLPAVSKWRFKPVKNVCVNESTFTYELEENA